MATVAAPTRRIGLGTVDIGPAEVRAVTDCLTSGHVSPGPFQLLFEETVAHRHGKRYATFVNSGQSALSLSLEALKRRLDKPTLKVLCPAVTYISTLHAVWNAQCDVVLSDVDPDDWMLREDTYRCDVVMPVDLFGKACGHRWRAPMLEDACEAIGAPGVGYGLLTCLSFYASHSITTGVGGMVLTDDDGLDDYVKRLANHGRKDAKYIHTLREGDYDLSGQFLFTDEGWSMKNSDLAAALGCTQMDRLDGILRQRRRNGLILLAQLRVHPELQLAQEQGHTFMMFPVLCREEGVKPRLVAHLNQHGIETRDAMPVVTQPIVQERLGIRPEDYQVAHNLARNGFYIGCHQKLTDDDLEYVLKAFDSFFGRGW